MRHIPMAIFASIAVAAAGCMRGEPGGPGVRTEPATQTHTVNKPVIDDSRDTFLLRTPAISTTIKQGESKSVSIAVSRGSEFKDDVQVTFSDVPQGVTLNPVATTLSASEKDFKVDIAAGADAEVGDFTVVVKGHPTKGGPDATNHLKFNVAAK